uniref:Elongation of fatty acids protein n=1 Tax=Trypanosoma congolense (strain IL3000) TaxID=1068625 RepID=F9WG52_TRYCI|nr:unnamed protein product [Trypanosoma congolense IL3000]
MYASLMDSYLSYIGRFNGSGLTEWMANNSMIPFAAAALYLILVFYVPRYVMADRLPFNLKVPNIVWNLLLTLYSMLGAYYTVPGLVRGFNSPVALSAEMNQTTVTNGSSLAAAGGFYTTTCALDRKYYFDGDVGFWVALFSLSKLPEMIDTVFLILQKKPVIFLHWYHHLTVMLFSWFAYIDQICSGIWFSSMNYSVHSVMYLYYFMCACGYRRLVRPFAPIITSMQILQMVVGTIIVGYTYIVKHFMGQQCVVSNFSLQTGLAMYVSYLLLFSRLFYRSYIGSPKVPTEAKKIK